MARSKMLCCTADRPDGWNHSTTTDHYNKTITLNITRHREDGSIEHHPASGQSWSYADADDMYSRIDEILDLTDTIGLDVGSLIVYERSL